MIMTNKIINNEPDKTNSNIEINNNTENETIPKQEIKIIELWKTELKTSPLKNDKQSEVTNETHKNNRNDIQNIMKQLFGNMEIRLYTN